MPRWNVLSDQQGVIALVVGLASVALLSFVAMVVDIGYGLVAGNELQNVADAAALAGARQLGRIYEGLTYDAQQQYLLTSPGKEAIIGQALAVSQRNRAGGQSMLIDHADVRIGQWDLQARSLAVTDANPTAVEVTARRDTVANGPVNTFFAGIMGIHTMQISAKATAALTGARKLAAGALGIPVGIAKKRFESPDFCGSAIRLYPTDSWIGCAGWHTYLETPANAATLKQILLGLLNRKYVIPEATSGQTQFIFIGGSVASDMPDLKALYKSRTDADGNWETVVIVYDRDDCSNPSGPVTVLGFAGVRVTNVVVPPDGKLVEGQVVCDVMTTGRGGGTDYGTKGSIPGLVQ